MGKYNIVRSEMWSDPEYKVLSPAGKLLYNYLLSGPASNIAGYYRLEIIQIKTNLCRYDRMKAKFYPEDEEFFESEVLPQLLSQEKLWMYDPNSEQVLIPNYLKYNTIGGPKQIAAVSKAIEVLSVCELHIPFFTAMLKYIGTASLDYINPQIKTDVKELCERLRTREAQELINNINTYPL